MNAPHSPETERLLRELFSGDPVLRERAMLAVAVHEREKVRELVNHREDAERLLTALLTDLGFASGHLRNDFQSQFWRRTSIRALAATIDGIVFTLKQLAFVDTGLTHVELSAEDLEFLREQPMSSSQAKLRLPGFRDNFKRTFKLFAKAHRTVCLTDFGRKGFEDLCQTYELRHRVTHPKSSKTFFVQDEETKRAGAAIEWLHRELDELLTSSHDSLGKQ